MAWYNEKGDMQDVVISTRVRFARNLEEYPFASRLSDKAADEIIDKVCAALPEYSAERFFDNGGLKLRSYMEMHYVSPEFASSVRHRALLSGEDGHVKIMVCEEDHLRIQSIVSGFDPKRAFEYAGQADDALGKQLKIAFNEKYGYLTHCPTNLGVAMRVSAMLCLPALTMSRLVDQYAAAMNKMGITIRGLYGEGSRPSGCLYQVSNRASLGSGENEIIKMMTEIVTKLVEAERKARASVFATNCADISDRVARSVGLLKTAYKLTSDEVTERFSDLKLGCALGIVEALSDEKLCELLIAVQPATVSLLREGIEKENERDVARAALTRDILKDVVIAYGKVS